MWLLTFALVKAAMSGPLATVNPLASPEKKVEAIAQKYDRKLAREVERDDGDGRFFITTADAQTAVADVLSQGWTLARVEGERLESDWRYESDAGVGASGEWFQQRRSRVVVRVTGSPESTVDVQLIAEQRRAEAGQDVPEWAADTWRAQADLAAVRTAIYQRCRALEDAALNDLRSGLSAQQLRSYAAASLPAGFTLQEGAESPLVAERVSTQREDGRRNQGWATWERRSRLLVHVLGNAAPYNLSFQMTEEDRFSTDSGEGSWNVASTMDQRVLEEFRQGLLLSASQAMYFPPSRSAAPSYLVRALSEPPPIPTLRTAAELQAANMEQQKAQALIAGAGWFRVSITEASVAATKPGGQSWDQDLSGLAGVTTQAVATSYVSQDAAQELGNAVASLVESYPTDPDVVVRLQYGQQGWALPVVYDSKNPTWAWSVTLQFDASSPALQLTLEDLDLTQSDAIGACSTTLRAILDAGEIQQLTCGSATLTIKADWVRSL
jgi:hypothetical protein